MSPQPLLFLSCLHAEAPKSDDRASYECWPWCGSRPPRKCKGCTGEGCHRQAWDRKSSCPKTPGSQDDVEPPQPGVRKAVSRGTTGPAASSPKDRRQQEERLPCGLLPSQVSDLLDRDITPEDYDMLLLLDEVLQRPTVPAAVVDKLEVPSSEECQGQACCVCMCSFDTPDVVSLGCKHFFHKACIAKWLTERSKRCPLCGHEA